MRKGVTRRFNQEAHGDGPETVGIHLALMRLMRERIWE
jgi:hypothetical protein